MLKHFLQISEARTRTKNGFESKLLGFAFLALQAQLLVRFLRKKSRALQSKASLPYKES